MNNYETIKQESLSGNITDKLFPFLWEYYQDVASIIKLKTYEEFCHAFTAYTNIPILMPNQSIIIPIQELIEKLPNIFNYLDKKYEKAAEK